MLKPTLLSESETRLLRLSVAREYTFIIGRANTFANSSSLLKHND